MVVEIDKNPDSVSEYKTLLKLQRRPSERGEVFSLGPLFIMTKRWNVL